MHLGSTLGGWVSGASPEGCKHCPLPDPYMLAEASEKPCSQDLDPTVSSLSFCANCPHSSLTALVLTLSPRAGLSFTQEAWLGGDSDHDRTVTMSKQ